MKLTIRALDGTERNVEANAADRVAWEGWATRQGIPVQPSVTVQPSPDGGPSTPTVDVSRFPMDTYNLYLAWRADTRTAYPNRPPFSDWLEQVENATPEQGDDDADPLPDPTHAGPGPA